MRIGFTFLAIISIILCAPALAYDWSTNLGDGSPENPYQISEPNHLIAIGLNADLLNKHFTLVNDIVFDPNNNPTHVFSQPIIGKSIAEPFSGSFDGGGFSVMNLYFNGDNWMGLFCAIEHPAGDPNYLYSVKDLVLINPTVRLIGGGNRVGCLVGNNVASTINNCTVRNPIIEADSSTDQIGCIAGYNTGTVRYCNVVNCSIAGQRLMGGLVGLNDYGNIKHCTVTGNIEGHSYIGLLVGLNYDGIIDACQTSGNTIGTEYSYYIGGLVGGNTEGNVSNCSTTGLVSGNSNVGGIAGDNSYGPMQRCSTSCLVKGVTNEPTKAFNIGGFIGHFDARSDSDVTIERCISTGNVSGYRASGGFIGDNVFGNMIHCYANGDVAGYREVGGLIGDNYKGGMQYCYASGIAEGDYNVEGFIGENHYIPENPIANCYFLLNGDQPYYSGIGLSELEMKVQASFIDWDFVGESTNGDNDVWRMCADGVGYPRLSWEFAKAGDFACGDGVDMGDLAAIAERWLLTEATDPTQSSYACDANGDGQINLLDLEAAVAELVNIINSSACK